MIPQVITLLKDNKGVSVLVTALMVVVLLGGTGTIELPADRAVAEVKTTLAQLDVKQQENWRMLHEHDREDELQRIDFGMRYATDQINRLNGLPEYLGRELNEQERWQLQQFKEEWLILKSRREELTSSGN